MNFVEHREIHRAGRRRPPPKSGEPDALAERKPVTAWITVAFLVGVTVEASAGTALGFWVSAKNLRESDARLKQARVLLQRAEKAVWQSETAPRPADDLPARAGRAVGRMPGARGDTTLDPARVIPPGQPGANRAATFANTPRARRTLPRRVAIETISVMSARRQSMPGTESRCTAPVSSMEVRVLDKR